MRGVCHGADHNARHDGRDELPPAALIAAVSSLTNVLRQVFAAFGTAIFATMLQTRQTFHQAMLSQTVTPDSLGVQTTVAHVQQNPPPARVRALQAKAAAVMLLYQQAASAASVRAFDNCFMIAAAFCLVGIIPAMFLVSKGTAGRTARPRAME